VKALPHFLARSPAWTKLPPNQRGNSIYLSGADGSVRSFNADDGALRWQSKALEEADQFLLDDSVVMTSSRRGVSALRLTDGTKLWSRQEALDLKSMSAQAVVASRRDDVKALSKNTGAVLWQTTSHEPLGKWGDRVFTVGGEKDSRETLQVRQPDTGRIAWSTTDGDIQHVVPNGDTLIYSASKFGRHHEKIQHISCRDETGGVAWEYRCTGELRSIPALSPDGEHIALSQKNPMDPSTSLLTVLDAKTGLAKFELATALKTEVAFAIDGSVVVSETEFARNPGEEKTWLRCVEDSGRVRWSRRGKPDWMTTGEQFVVAVGSRLSQLELESGREIWSLSLEGDLSPVSRSQSRLTVLEDGCRLTTVDLSQGQVTGTLSSGERIFVGQQGRLSDHQGNIWKETVEPFDPSSFVGRWNMKEPFHIAMKAGPTERNTRQAVFVDWDGDETDDGTDPILLDSERIIMSPSALKSRDLDGDQRLETVDLAGLSLWFDSNGDGEISSEAEINPLLSSAFDKGRIELDQSLLWLASDSRCPSA
jgi:outer membrane protein assembly factor BamB